MSKMIFLVDANKIDFYNKENKSWEILFIKILVRSFTHKLLTCFNSQWVYAINL